MNGGTLHVEHEIIGGETVLEEFDGVESFVDPPMTDTIVLSFVDDRDDERLRYGRVVQGELTNE